MIDIHCHVLPGLDDGPRHMDTSLALLEELVRQGVGTVICTPHFSLRNMHLQNYRDHEAIFAFLDRRDQVLHALTAAAAERGLNVRLLPGLEIDIAADLPDLLSDKSLAGRFGLAGSSYILLEFTKVYPESLQLIDTLLYELQAGGLTPVLAHPERTLQNTPENLCDILRNWAAQERVLLQVNAGSIADLNRPFDLPWQQGYGRRRVTRRLIDDGLVSFVASDAHHPELRPPQLAAARDWLVRKKGRIVADRLLGDNGRRLLSGDFKDM